MKIDGGGKALMPEYGGGVSGDIGHLEAGRTCTQGGGASTLEYGGGASCRLPEYPDVLGEGPEYGGLPDYVENKKTDP